MKNIMLIATGGTIASKHTERGMMPQITSEEIISCVPEIEKYCRVSAVQLFNLDSTNIYSYHWMAIARCIQKNYSDYDGFVVTHGTDTMAYTAAALSYMIQNSPKPIVITGSQKSIYDRDTDARNNLTDAFIYASSDAACGVHIAFDGKIILGTRARKTRTKSFNAFDSINYPPVAVVQDGRLINYIKEERVSARPDFYLNFDSKVFVLKLVPGLNSRAISALSDFFDAFIIEGFGVGGVPVYKDMDFVGAIEGLLQCGKTVVMTTQVMLEGSDMTVYQVGREIKSSLDLIEAYDMTTEAVVTKLMWILGLTGDRNEIKRLFYTPVSKDIL